MGIPNTVLARTTANAGGGMMRVNMAILEFPAPEKCGDCPIRTTGYPENSLNEYDICVYTRKNVYTGEALADCPLKIVEVEVNDESDS